MATPVIVNPETLAKMGIRLSAEQLPVEQRVIDEQVYYTQQQANIRNNQEKDIDRVAQKTEQYQERTAQQVVVQEPVVQYEDIDSKVRSLSDMQLRGDEAPVERKHSLYFDEDDTLNPTNAPVNPLFKHDSDTSPSLFVNTPNGVMGSDLITNTPTVPLRTQIPSRQVLPPAQRYARRNINPQQQQLLEEQRAMASQMAFQRYAEKREMRKAERQRLLEEALALQAEEEDRRRFPILPRQTEPAEFDPYVDYGLGNGQMLGVDNYGGYDFVFGEHVNRSLVNGDYIDRPYSDSDYEGYDFLGLTNTTAYQRRCGGGKCNMNAVVFGGIRPNKRATGRTLSAGGDSAMCKRKTTKRVTRKPVRKTTRKATRKTTRRTRR